MTFFVFYGVLSSTEPNNSSVSGCQSRKYGFFCLSRWKKRGMWCIKRPFKVGSGLIKYPQGEYARRLTAVVSSWPFLSRSMLLLSWQKSFPRLKCQHGYRNQTRTATIHDSENRRESARLFRWFQPCEVMPCRPNTGSLQGRQLLVCATRMGTCQKGGR